MSALVLLSGGIDSAVALGIAAYEKESPTLALFVDYGQFQYRQEHMAVRALCHYYSVPVELASLPWEIFRPSKDTHVVPFRNGTLLSLAAALAEKRGLRWIYSGIYSDPTTASHLSQDTSEAFQIKIGDAILLGTGSKVGVQWLGGQELLPTKKDVVLLARHLEVPLQLTWTCYDFTAPLNKQCGKCRTCLKRIKAFKEAGFVDPAHPDGDLDWEGCKPW